MTLAVLAHAGKLQQVTFGAYGHTLNHRQVLSPEGRFAYYDTRNADPDIMVTDRIERVDLQTLQIETCYRVPHPAPHGPGVGAVVCHPHREELLFIHGLNHCSPDQPYGPARRFGALWSPERQDNAIAHLEARCIERESPWGALRGGTHAHSWSADGRAVSFTYNDAFVDEQHQLGVGPPDLRTVGVAFLNQPVALPQHDDDNFSGTAWSMLIAPVTHAPRPGSDDMESAREECWLGNTGEQVAFLGRVRTRSGQAIDEIFVARWPKSPWTCDASSDRDGGWVDGNGRLQPPSMVSVRRLTRTDERPHPGVQGPRNWLVASPTGNPIYCPMRDDAGIVQVFAVDTPSGTLRQITWLQESLENQIALAPDGRRISLVSKGRIWIVEVESLECRGAADVRTSVSQISGAVHFLPHERGLLFHAFPKNSANAWQQLWTLSLQ